MGRAALIPLLMACAGCTMPPTSTNLATFDPIYEGVETRLLDADLVNFTLSMRQARSPADLRSYGDCVAAQYALIRGYRFARHVRTNVGQQGDRWTSDAVYTISAYLPRGTHTLDAGLTVSICQREGIPTI
ncbi:MAG: hypothetical protein MK180_00555 [Rhodobacteraceae bacterium]|nr:hypothetical protein [Paracoccaceae bacterium]